MSSGSLFLRGPGLRLPLRNRSASTGRSPYTNCTIARKTRKNWWELMTAHDRRRRRLRRAEVWTSTHGLRLYILT
eukprot:2907013-Pyramimonas_sp.AAC.1